MGTIPARALPVGEAAAVDVSSHFRDPDGDRLSYTAASSNPDIVGVSVSGSSVMVTAVARGVATVTATARDPQGLLAQQRFEVTVPNRAPEVGEAIPAQTLFTGETAAIDASSYFRDPDGDSLTYAAASSDAGVVAVSVAGVSGDSVAVTALAKGVATITVTARDGQSLAAEQRFEITVPNRAPEAVGTLPPLTLAVGETEVVVASSYFRDPDGDSLTYTAASSDAGVVAVSVAGVSGDSVAATALAKGVATITVTARDGQSLAAEQRFEITVPNRAPEVADAIPAHTLPVGEAATVDVSTHFRDPDGDPLAYAATSSDSAVATVTVSGATLTIRGVGAGVATVTVTASDSAGATIASPFEVTVVRTGGSFQIELAFATPVTRAQEAAFQRAAERWMAILAPTELPDARFSRTVDCGEDPRFQRHVETIDDLMIVVAVGEIDGPHGVLGRAGPCWIRTATSLPVYGRIEMDAADLDQLETGDLEEVILHEMGHVLGIGIIWSHLDLLRNPASETSTPDTHFTGPLAIAAFDEAGGAGYGGAKVPVENMGGSGSRNSHWRESVLVLELMTPFQNIGVGEPLSAITIESLADLGYEVDATWADPYELPSADMARAIEAAPKVPYGDDIWRGPLVVVDPDGRIVRVIPR
ncbi:putative Ig domain-containing protein [Candidatus Palauibacter sp.]|uniref:putative Ig domain-containing protein n=1 Tax=Candidatus Palauibacter sp. TaxID=3101350 RepID=UPI003B51632A